MALTCINDVEHVYMCLLVIHVSSLPKYLFKSIELLGLKVDVRWLQSAPRDPDRRTIYKMNQSLSGWW